VDTDRAQLVTEIGERDRLDSIRAESPLRRASDAVVLDTSMLSIDEQVDFVVGKAREIMERETKE
jgi:cytidylate kinase